ncbi:uncharacterized protein LOC127096140 [Lathyrus oleraceus]|uniref:uncharacterized protein LOC127096140 n=1 Tax=Pisum sativum TaxID=3888 RepID=UPI0021D1E364|nr:uncharacterized protein LOC127096140 [Pisum sativum]
MAPPTHGGHRVNCVEGAESEDLVVRVDEIQTSLLVVKGHLLDGGVHPGCDECCMGCAESDNGCMQLRAGIKRLVDEGCVQFGRTDNGDRGAVSTVTIFFKLSEGRGPRTVGSAPTISGNPVTIFAPVSANNPTMIVAPVRRAENSKVVPWRYDNAYRSNKRAENRVRPTNQAPVTIVAPSKTPMVVSPVVDNVGGPGGFTRSGRLFAPQPLRDANTEASARAKGKQAVVDEEPAQTNVPDDLRKEGVDISDFNISQLPNEPPNFMKRPRGPSEKAKQAKKARLGESSGSRHPAPLLGPSGKSVSLAPSVQTHHIASSIPQPTPIYTSSETPPSTTRTSHQPSQKFNLATTTLPICDAEMLNETISPSSSSSPKSPPYYNISTDTEHSDPPSPTLPQLQTRALASQQPPQPTPEPEVISSPTEQPNPTTSDPQPSKTTHAETQPNNSDTHPPNTSAEPQTPTLNLSHPTSPPLSSEPENTMPTLEEAIMLFVGASVDKVKDAELRLQERLAREAKERAHKEAEEKARQEEIQRIKEVEAKALAEAVAAKAEAKPANEAKARLAEESANRVEPDALTQGESSTFAPLVLKTLEDLQKEQKEV